MKKWLFPVVPAAVSLIAGWIVVSSLTVHPSRLFAIALIGGLLFAALLGLIIYLLVKRRFDLVIVSVCCFTIGYLVKTRIFLSREDDRFIPELTRSAGPGAGHTAVVYFTHGEPETFNPIGWLNQFREFDEQGIRFVPLFARPLFVSALRHKYMTVGKSGHREEHGNMLRSLESLYRQEGDSTTRFYLSFLDDEPRPDAAVIRALNEGASRIVVATVFLTVSNHVAEGVHQVEQVGAAERFGVPLEFTEPLWESESLRLAFLDKVMARMGDTPRAKVGIALVGHGQPDEWDREWPTETSQEIGFRDLIINMFIENGFKAENLGKAWMDFKEPKPYELMDQFVKNGVEKIFYFAAAISANAIHSQADIPNLINEYPFPSGLEVINLGAWNNHPMVIRAIKEKVDRKLQEVVNP